MVKTINCIIVGISGKIGNLVYQKAKDSGINVVCGVDLKTITDVDCPVYKSFDEVKENVDLIIDFSSPASLKGIMGYLEINPCPLFIGTTGYDEKEENIIKKISKKVPVFKTSNTSIGITLIKNVVSFLSDKLPQFKAYIVEKHRENKKDLPSGTSLSIKNCFNENDKDVEIFSMRGGDIFGEHEIFFICQNEVISIKHTALSRDLFIEGALKACLFLLTKKSGLYGMTDYVENSKDFANF